MSPHLLDIRIGRANRREFLFVVFVISAIVLLLQDFTLATQIGTFALLFIIGTVFYIARAHDVGIKDITIIRLFFISIVPPLFIFCIISVLSPYEKIFDDYGLMSLVLKFYLTIISILPSALIVFISFFLLSYLEGNSLDNEHGYPSLNFSFNKIFIYKHMQKAIEGK